MLKRWGGHDLKKKSCPDEDRGAVMFTAKPDLYTPAVLSFLFVSEIPTCTEDGRLCGADGNIGGVIKHFISDWWISLGPTHWK